MSWNEEVNVQTNKNLNDRVGGQGQCFFLYVFVKLKKVFDLGNSNIHRKTKYPKTLDPCCTNNNCSHFPNTDTILC